MRLIAVDIDLRRIHAWDSESGEVCYQEPDFGKLHSHLASLGDTATLLVEVAGPISHRDGDQSTLYHTHRWMLWNIGQAALLHQFILATQSSGHCTYGPPLHMLVATSTAWTRGHPEKQRHAIACADAKNHDLRECQTMINFFKLHPQAWKPLPQWLADL